jgi:regulator of replication initiation timing
MQRAMARRVEDEIRKLCKELLAGKDDDQQIQKLVELRAALRLHIERLRTRAADYPIIPERRQHAAIPRAESTGD